MSRRIVLLAAAALACSGSTRPPATPKAAPPAAAATAAPPIGAAAEPAVALDPNAAPSPEWSYSSAGKRDPFRSYLRELDTPAHGIASRCATPLGRFDIEQLRLVAVVTGLEDPVAMVEAPNGIGYSLRRGACIGKNGGVISSVRSGEVVVSEWAIRADGTRDKTETVIRLPKEPSLTLEE
jgi:type IV pilus assembly protein PilP